MSVNPAKGGSEPAESHMHMTKLHTHTHTHTEAECVYNTPKDIKCTPAWFLCVRPVSVGFVSLMTFVLTLRILRVRGGTIRGIHRKTNIHYSFISSVRRDKLWIIHKTKLCTSPAPPRHAAFTARHGDLSVTVFFFFCTTVAIFSHDFAH